jgi:Reverse transcriptase (RNA-dependent DNA polymerase)
MPILKKSDLDHLDTKSYRPIFNLSIVSKLLERLVSRQLVAYHTDNGIFPDLQSAYRANHSTEIAVVKVLSDILTALNSGNLAVLMLLDLSAAFAFASVDHAVVLQRLRTSYGLDGTIINWFASYINGRTQCVRSSMTSSLPSALLYGVSQVFWCSSVRRQHQMPTSSVSRRCIDNSNVHSARARCTSRL